METMLLPSDNPDIFKLSVTLTLSVQHLPKKTDILWRKQLMIGFSIQPWLFWALLSAVFAAFTAIFAKIGVDRIDSDVATFIRTAVILLLGLALFSMGKFQTIEKIGTRAWVFLIFSGLATGASWFCYFRALKAGDAVRVAPIDKLSVVFVAIIAFALLGERMPMQGWVGIILIAIGAAFVATA
jgi:transporter family protein